MDVGTMFPPPAPRFFRREFEKTPSPEKEQDVDLADLDLELELEKAFSAENDFTDLELAFDNLPSPEKEEDVLDFTDLELELAGQDKSFADELLEIEERMAGAALDLPTFKPREDGKMMRMVSQKYIRALMKSPPPSEPLPVSVDAHRCTGIKDEEVLETVARSFRTLQSAVDIQNDIIRQYRAKGYAYIVVPEDS